VGRAEFFLDAVDGKSGLGGNRVVVPFQRHARSGERADDGDGLACVRLEWQRGVIVFQQHH